MLIKAIRFSIAAKWLYSERLLFSGVRSAISLPAERTRPHSPTASEAARRIAVPEAAKAAATVLRVIFDQGLDEVQVVASDEAQHRIPAGHVTHTPNGRRVVIGMHCDERNRLQLYEFDPQNEDLPTLVKGHDHARHNGGGCWTPDGKRMMVVSRGD